MALFTNEDAERVMLASQLVQVSPAEIEAFAKQCLKVEHGLPPTTIEKYAASAEWPTFLDRLTELNEFAVDILSTAADRGKVHEQAIDGLIEESLLCPTSRTLNYNAQAVDSEGFVAPSELSESISSGSSMVLMIASAIHQLMNVCKHPERVRRCEICCNPYIVQRETGKNRFCSHRCGKRNYDRNRKKSKITIQ